MAFPAALADDAVAIGRVSLRGPGSAASVRAQLSACPAPSLRGFVFVGRLTLATRGGSVAPEFSRALERLARAHGGDPEVVAFDSFAELAVAFARDALTGVAASRWHWRRLGLLPHWSGAGAAIALLAEQPLEVWAVLQRWHEERLLAPVWRGMPPEAAATLLAAIGWATRQPLPPDTAMTGQTAEVPARLLPAATFWREAVAGATPAAVHAAAVLSLLRWHPVGLASPSAAIQAAALRGAWHAATAIAAGAPAPGDPPLAVAMPLTEQNASPATPQSRLSNGYADSSPIRVVPPADATTPVVAAAEQHEIPTGVGGTLFLINALNRLSVLERLLAWPDGEPPTGWQLLRDLALRLGAPADDGLIGFLSEQIDAPLAIGPIVGELAAAAAELYRAEEVWPDFIHQPGLLRVTPSHLDLDLHATAIDIRIRRSGLDLDPAWVPWLGRIVRFHYPHLPQRQAG